MRVLAGDIGGTNSRLAVFECRADRVEMLNQTIYRSADHDGLSDVVAAFVATSGARCDKACLGLPGPVFGDEVVQLTNLPWKIDRCQLKEILNTEKLVLVNDVQASAAGIDQLGPEQVVQLRTGTPDPHGNRVVVSIGTGLGVATLSPSGRAYATEGGHTAFAPKTDFDIELLGSLTREFGRVSWERLASGQGLPRIYAFMSKSGKTHLSSAEIVARAESDAVCGRAVATFRRYIGSVAGDIALTVMATGGLYFAGGVAPPVINHKGAGEVMHAFFDKGRMRPLLERIPVTVVLDDNLALIGAAQLAFRL